MQELLRDKYKRDGFSGIIKSAPGYTFSKVIKPVNYVTHLQEHWYGRKIRKNTKTIIDKDWDNLIILDGCRYDAFENNSNIEGNLEKHISLGYSSSSFMKRNFSNHKGRHNDIIYITANRHDPLNKDAFFQVIDNDNNWDSELGTIPPEPVIEQAKETIEKYPNKKLIIHLMQPHDPPINKNGLIIDCNGWVPRTIDASEYSKEHGESRMWDMLEAGELEKERAWTAYVKTLQYVLKLVDDFESHLMGKTVITSDHGLLFGEKPFSILSSQHYGTGPYAPKINEVPWFTFPFKQRKTIEK